MDISSFKTIQKVVKPDKIYNLYYFKKIRGFSLDSGSIKKGDAFIALPGKYKDGHDFIGLAVKKGAASVIAAKYTKTSPKVPQFIVDDTLTALKRIILFLRKKYKKAVVFAVTGSLGKTTTKEMLGFILEPYQKVLKNKATENNLFGVAKTIFSYDNHDSIIFELGTNREGELESLAEIIRPDIGIVTCIRPAHLEGLGDIDKIKKEKLSIFKKSQKIKAILNSKDPLLAKAKLKNKIFWFGRDKKNNLYYRFVKRKGDKVYFKILDKYDLILPLRFENFIDDYLAAILAARLLGYPYRELILRMGFFKNFPPMRMEKRQIGNYLVLNDAYNANPHSFRQALLALKHFRLPKVVVAADMLELGSKSADYHRKLASQILKSGCSYCITYGEHTKITNKQLKALNYKNVFHFSSLKKIASFLKKEINNEKYLIFLKGSRKMQLEDVLKYL